jgi:hypothetical protein
MLTEYKIKLEKDGLSITQRIEPTASQPLPVFAANNALQASYERSKNVIESKNTNASNPKSGGSGLDDPGPGSGGFTGSTGAPITIIGPNILMCCPCSQSHKEKKEE